MGKDVFVIYFKMKKEPGLNGILISDNLRNDYVVKILRIQK